MKFNRLQLVNIGQFWGRYDFNIQTLGKEKNVVLIGGKNGSGKTTILEAIRLALYGTFSFGLKNESPAYFEKIDARLNTQAKKTNDRFFQIILEVEIVEDWKKNEYVINRSWTRNKNSLKEGISLKRNGIPLKDQEVELFFSRLREETPPQLLEFCLFDGEKISQVVSKETLSEYLQQTAKVMFNLDLFENLEADLFNYLKQDDVMGTLSIEEKNLLDLENECNEVLNKYEQSLDELNVLETKIENATSHLTEQKRQFNVHGGLVKERRDELINEINMIENQRFLKMEKNKDFIQSLFPFVIVKDLVAATVSQMKTESKNEVKNNVAALINTNDLTNLFNTHVDGFTLNEEKSDLILKGLFELISSENEMTIHNASSQQRAEIESFNQQISLFNPEELLRDFKQNTELLKQVQKLKKQIDKNDSSSDLKELIDNIRDIEDEIKIAELKKRQLQEIVELAHTQMDEKNKAYELQKEKIINAKKAGNIFEISTRVLDVSRAFRTRQIRKKLQQVEQQTAFMLQAIFRKELFIKRVKIHPETFQLKIYDAAQEEISIENISAGEKQILLLATVWAMAMCSNRRLPFVFDTLLGRLDQTHKKSIIEFFIPRCGEQVIILATDSEINEENFSLIEPILAKTYTIDYDADRTTVKWTDQYFNMSIKQEELKHEL
ncbi:DNA sulfur modification protein DndD [Paenibacillus odorifer]|uniref:DNA sulfur modification protein DndD n=1 Tax=Paenibacillus odorifer TaxID=189426 RepID=UPI00096FAA75|nr:DNA sulfur modification protein DndD [Paenibacillus odorifer]OME27739.1 DNA sulfur modification protein DndD [Paenibacillus odorifer]